MCGFTFIVNLSNCLPKSLAFSLFIGSIWGCLLFYILNSCPILTFNLIKGKNGSLLFLIGFVIVRRVKLFLNVYKPFIFVFLLTACSWPSTTFSDLVVNLFPTDTYKSSFNMSSRSLLNINTEYYRKYKNRLFPRQLTLFIVIFLYRILKVTCNDGSWILLKIRFFLRFW